MAGQSSVQQTFTVPCLWRGRASGSFQIPVCKLWRSGRRRELLLGGPPLVLVLRQGRPQANDLERSPRKRANLHTLPFTHCEYNRKQSHTFIEMCLKITPW